MDSGSSLCNVEVLPLAGGTLLLIHVSNVAADYLSGQRGLTVNQLAMPTGVRIPHLPQRKPGPDGPGFFMSALRELPAGGMAAGIRISPGNQGP